ncbi:protein of unknown function [Aquimarina amphilecti]|uniref:DUF4386 domain-containing protein n=1 Tax=Aquimarina amphilecti TaxID=1038014 RepID=A0A1H7HIG8_AQUAM|nr:DUF4386 family protein [Aquimarina amphilecti]SEK48025.1 protein of unknown function [Aquimarina amphilecti]
MITKNTQKIGGVCSIFQSLIYITAFIVYGGILTYPDENATVVEELNFLSENYKILSILNFTSYILFGVLLTVLVLAIHKRLKRDSPDLSKLGLLFGVIWAGLVIACGMITNIGLNTILETGITSPENAMQIWSSISIVSEGLGGGNEIVGGIWVLLISIISINNKSFSKLLTLLGIIVGTAGVLTIYPLDLFTEIFGISQIIWFLWIGIVMIRKPNI